MIGSYRRLGPIVVFTEGLSVAAEFVELAAEPVDGTPHAQIPDADRDSIPPNAGLTLITILLTLPAMR
jgi:hypothetical protein